MVITMKKLVSIILLITIIACTLAFPASALHDSGKSTDELIQAIPTSDGAAADGIFYDLFINFIADPNGFVAVLDSQPAATRDELVEHLALYCTGDLRERFEEALSRLDPSETADALKKSFESAKDAYQENIRTDIYMPEYDSATIKNFVNVNKEIGFIYDEELYSLLSEVYNADTNVFAKAIDGLTTSDMDKIALGMTVFTEKAGFELKADFSKGKGLTNAEQLKMTAFETALSAAETTASSEMTLKEATIEIFNADLTSVNTETNEEDQESALAAAPSIGSMGWSNLKVGSASTRLNVVINDSGNSTSTRTYCIRVYCNRPNDSQWWMKNSGYKAVLVAGTTSFRAQVPVSFSAAGTFYTRVELWNASNSAMLTRQYKSGSDVVKGDWRINVDLPTNRFREGALGVYNASGEMVLPVIRCLGRSVYNTPMGETDGNTPVGNNNGTLIGPDTDTGAYGPYKRVLLTARPGHPYPNRFDILIHGGRDQTSLAATKGCIRVFNADQLKIQNKLESLMLPANGHNTTGTVIVAEYSYLD